MRLSYCILVVFAVVVAVAGAETVDNPDMPYTEPKPFNPRESIAKVAIYQSKHPEFAANILTWMATGVVLFVGGTVLFLWSEIQAMLVVRDQDFRKRLLAQGYMSEAANIEHLNAEESANMKLRPYLTFLGTALVFVGIACVLYPLCDIITVLGLPSAPCLLIVTFGSLFSAICQALLWMFFIWVCTRPAAALLLLCISVAGQVLIPTGNPIFLLVWMLSALLLPYVYFFWLPEQYLSRSRPSWLQDIGNLQVSHKPEEMLAAFETKISLEARKHDPTKEVQGMRLSGQGQPKSARRMD